jgi:hypothetical protein
MTLAAPTAPHPRIISLTPNLLSRGTLTSQIIRLHFCGCQSRQKQISSMR